MVDFYETEDYTSYVDFMLDEQIEVVEKLSNQQFVEQQENRCR